MMRSRVNMTTMLFVLILSLMAAFCSAKNNKQSDTKPVSSCPSCNNGGQTGMWTYMTCVPGAPGAPGRDGAKGELGSPGKTGTQGPRGADGKKGAKGEPGIQGSAGQKGERGDKGDSVTPRLASHTNWKECAWKKADGKDSGLIYNCDFLKKYPDTSLHVYYAGNFRVHGCDDCCSRWYFTFNGAECSSPGTIDGALYLYTLGQKLSPQHHRHIEGHCNNIQKGKVRVGFWVGKCVTGHKLSDAYTGWHSLSRIFVEEVPKAQQ
ncbi:unnamed protein product [Porites evermanni]|uniref:CTHRC1 C-terminal domain-containing protein n=1 Tax=Porites evermanni TaxID=104178 RepID=A0ABN8SQY2_9CNID|nr:unnamed protein product [Porites evermanni]